jgi:putative alpha-1,2-mannosidase
MQGGPDGDDMRNRVGGIFNFSSSEIVQSRVGISFISTDKACTFAQEEIRSWTLRDTVIAAVEEWNRDILSKVKVSGSTNTTRLTMLYSGLYLAHLLPSDRPGENPNWNSTEPYYDDYYTIWDTFRCLNSFYLLVQKSRAVGMIRSLIDIWRHDGYMPDGRSGNYNGKVQGGSNADNVLADAFVKGVIDGINCEDGYAAMKKRCRSDSWQLP